MRQGLKDRIKFNPSQPSRMSMIKTDYLTRNSYNNKIPNNGCAPTGSCSNSKDANGFWVGTNQETQLTNRKYYAPFRQPLKGWRKTLHCSTVYPSDFSNTRRNCLTTTEIYKDVYADCSGNECMNNGSISNSKIPLTGTQAASKSSTGNATRTHMPLIRSGMQPNIAGKQNSGLSNTLTATRYSYSYRELINNRRKATQIKKLATEQPTTSDYMSSINPASRQVPGYGGDCPEVDSCNPSQTIYRYNNPNFATQGAVESSDRITRLKIDTIKSQSRCPSGQQTGPKEARSDCNGPYKPNHIASSGTNTWPLIDNSKKSQVKYNYLFNENHTEVNYPQVSALARVRGSSGNNRYTTGEIISNGSSTCPTSCPPQFLM